MNYCCICGKKLSDQWEDSAKLVVKGEKLPICGECADLLGSLKGNKQNAAADELRKKIAEQHCTPDVRVAVNAIILAGYAERRGTAENGQGGEDREEQAFQEGMEAFESDTEIYSENSRSIYRRCDFLEIVLSVGFFFAIIAILVIGIPMMKIEKTEAIGLGIMIGGIFASILIYVMLSLLLKVATAIGKIDDKMNAVTRRMDQTLIQMKRIADHISDSDKATTQSR